MNNIDTDDFSILTDDAPVVARRLLGCLLERELDGQRMLFKIVETEAYDQTDAASHSFNGRTPRTDVMFGPAGRLYVYFTYGMHYCCNVVIGQEGYGAAVLVRAIEPLGDYSVITERRGGKTGVDLTNGPAKLCQALGIDRHMNGHELDKMPLRLLIEPELSPRDIVVTHRVGISKAKDVQWRYYIAGNPYVSVKEPNGK